MKPGPKPANAPCRVEGCDDLTVGQGLCRLHYNRERSGVPLDAPRKPKRSIHNECTYRAAHTRVGYLWSSARDYPCYLCGRQAYDWAYDHTDPTELTSELGPYSRYPEFYGPLCRQCHKVTDTARIRANGGRYKRRDPLLTESNEMG